MQLCIIYFCLHSIHFKEFIWNTFTESHFENVLKVVLLLLFIFVSLHLFSKHSFLYSIYSYCIAQRPLLYDRYSFGLRYNQLGSNPFLSRKLGLQEEPCTLYTVKKGLADSLFVTNRFCKALCDVKFSQIEGNGRQFSHIWSLALTSSVIFSNSLVCGRQVVSKGMGSSTIRQ